MGCVCTTPDQYVACASLPVRFSQADVEAYAHRVGAQGGKDNWVFCYVVACLRVNRIIYWRNEPGDCGGQTGGRSGAAVGFGVASAGLAATGAGAPLAFVTTLLGGIFQHHAQAVKREQDTLCDVFTAFNSFADAAEANLQSGQWSVADADNALSQVHDQLTAEAGSIAHQFNAAYGVVKALDALQVFNSEKVFQERQGLLGSALNSLGSAVGGAAGSVGGNGGGVAKVLAVGAGWALGKFLGVF